MNEKTVTICVGSDPYRHVAGKSSLQFSVGDSAAPFLHRYTGTFYSSGIIGSNN